MNNVILCGRLTKDPLVNVSQNGNIAIARYTLAVDRRFKPENGQGPTADFISCVCFGKTAEFAEKYLHKGMKMLIRGRIQTGSYQNKEGHTVYTTDIVVEDHEFVEKKASNGSGSSSQPVGAGAGNQAAGGLDDGFMSIPDDVIEDGELPFN